MDLFTRADLRSLLAAHDSPCISLFMPTHRGGAEEDPIRFRNLLHRAEEQAVSYGLRAADVREFLSPLNSVLADRFFWTHQSDGLAVFLARNFLKTYRLPWAFHEELEVGGLFHVVPLLPLLTDDGRFFVLALSQNSVRLFQGTHFTIGSVNLEGAPSNLAEAMRTHDRDEVLTFHSRPTSGGTWGEIFEGHGVGIDDKKDDLLRYFEQIDRGLHAVLRKERVPLILASVGYLMPIYRQASKYSHLLEEGIEGNPDRLTANQLHDRAWAIVEPHFEAARQHAVARYHQLIHTGHASSDIRQVVAAAYRGKLETAFVCRGNQLWGLLDSTTNEVEYHDQPVPGDEDLLNIAAIQTLKHGGSVYAMPPKEMPGKGLLAAIFREPLYVGDR